MSKFNFYLFGDSITYGAWDLEQGGWASRFRNHIDWLIENEVIEDGLVYNLGISGETTAGLKDRFINEVTARGNEKLEKVFIFAFGANDAAFIPSKDDFKLDIETFKNNYLGVLREAKKLSNKIAILTITPVNEQFTAKPVGKDKSRINDYVKKYNDVIKEIAKTEDIVLVDINELFITNSYETQLCEDGLHPNESGHSLIAGAVTQMIHEQWLDQ